MRDVKRWFALVLAFVLLITVMPLSSAEESDAYVLYHEPDTSIYDGPKFQYFSPYLTTYTYDGTSTWIQNHVFTLYNSLTAEAIPAYCTDVWVGVTKGSRYRQLNLEESTYAGDKADQLRAIVLNGFYLMPISGETEAEHAVRVAAKLQELGTAAGVADLTIGEAISATQGAIWEAAHGSLFEVLAFMRNSYDKGDSSLTQWYNICSEECTNGHIVTGSYGSITEDCKAEISARIAAVYDYLLSLEPIAPAEPMASVKSFLFAGAAAPVENDDGTYDIEVKTTVDVNMVGGDLLTLTAKMGDITYATAPLSDGTQTLSMTLENVPAEDAFDDVMLAIDGKQTVYDVFLFDAEGDREASQTMIGMNHSRMPVHASTRATRMTDVEDEQPDTNERIIYLYKTTYGTTEDGSGRIPLEGITFDVYFVASMDDYMSGAVTVPAPENFVPSGDPVYTLVTDGSGYAYLNLTEHGLPDGAYMVVERSHPAIIAPAEPIQVVLPRTNDDGTGFEYDITLRPKNTVKGNVRIEKDVQELGNDKLSVDAYANHTWIIGATIPDDIADGKSYVISDALDPRLDYVGNLRVQVESADGTQILAELVAEQDYTLSLTDGDSLAEGTGDSFTLSLSRSGMQKLAATVTDNGNIDCMLRMYFDAQINANAEMGTEIPNQATLEYTNSLNFIFTPESDIPVVYTGGAKLLKVDAENNSVTLEGANFTLYRKATEQEVAEREDLLRIEGFAAPMVKAYFYDNAQLSGEKVCSGVTDENGILAFYGLAYGEYYLCETEAPEGYNLLRTAVVLNIHETSHTEEMILVIENVEGAILPSTGGVGTTVFFACGFAMMLLAVVLLITKRRAATE